MKLFRLTLLLIISSSLCLPASAKHANKTKTEKPAQSSSEQNGATNLDQSLDELLAKPTNGNNPEQPDTASSTPAINSRENDTAAKDDKVLHGSLEDLQMLLTAPVVPNKKNNQNRPLSGRTSEQALDNAIDGQPLQPKTAPVKAPVLKGAAVLNGGKLAADSVDPDDGDKELMVEWDRWRNRFLRAVQLQVQAGVNNPDYDEDVRTRIDMTTGRIIPRFPLGTEAWFYCEITNSGRIRSLKITQSSGIPAYDRAILEGVRALDGTSILRYPSGSHRVLVNQEAGIQTATRAQNNYFHFGDVERYRGQNQY